MRPSTFHLLPASLLATLATALQLPEFHPFTTAVPQLFHEAVPQALDNTTEYEYDLLKRQYSNTCPQNFANCAAVGAAGLCCISNAVCTADQAGMVACCPSGAACTGTITGYVLSGTVDTNGALIGGAATTGNAGIVDSTASTTSFQFYSTTSTQGLVPATTAPTVATDGGQATGNGFIIDGSSTVATPGAGRRRADIPIVVQAIVHVLEYLPV